MTAPRALPDAAMFTEHGAASLARDSGWAPTNWGPTRVVTERRGLSERLDCDHWLQATEEPCVYSAGYQGVGAGRPCYRCDPNASDFYDSMAYWAIGVVIPLPDAAPGADDARRADSR